MGTRAATDRCYSPCCKSDPAQSNVGMNLTSIQHPKTGQGSTHVLMALQSSSLRAGSGWGKCPDESQGCRIGAFALLLPPLGAWGQLLGLSLHDHDTNKQIQ